MSGFIHLLEEHISLHYCFLQTSCCHKKGSSLCVSEKKVLHEIQDIFLRDRKSVGRTMMSQIPEAQQKILALKARPT